jgi:hypothetical protein
LSSPAALQLCIIQGNQKPPFHEATQGKEIVLAKKGQKKNTFIL